MAKTLSARIDALESAITQLVALETARVNAPKAAPAKAKAESPFVAFLHERAAAKIPCELGHGKSCNRKFSPVSSGRLSHVAKIV